MAVAQGSLLAFGNIPALIRINQAEQKRPIDDGMTHFDLDQGHIKSQT
jgi:hypothetical protein